MIGHYTTGAGGDPLGGGRRCRLPFLEVSTARAGVECLKIGAPRAGQNLGGLLGVLGGLLTAVPGATGDRRAHRSAREANPGTRAWYKVISLLLLMIRSERTPRRSLFVRRSPASEQPQRTI